MLNSLDFDVDFIITSKNGVGIPSIDARDVKVN